MAKECTKYHKKLAELLSSKTGEEYSKVVNFMRTRLRFTLLKSTLIAIRGDRGKARKAKAISELCFNTMPDIPSCEVWSPIISWRLWQCSIMCSSFYLITSRLGDGLIVINLCTYVLVILFSVGPFSCLRTILWGSLHVWLILHLLNYLLLNYFLYID